MARVQGLFGLTLVSVLSINSGVAMSKVPEQVTKSSSSAQTQPIVTANIFRGLGNVIRGGNTINQILRNAEQRQQAQQRQQQQEADRALKLEQRRLEAERQQQYFESLSPEQKQAYVAEQRARQERTALLMMTIFGAMVSGDANESLQKADVCDGIYTAGMSAANPCR